MKTSEALTKAAEIMVERGHTHGNYLTLRGVCALGAIFLANGAEVVNVTVADKLIGYTLVTDVPGYDSIGTVKSTGVLRDFLRANADRFGWRDDPFEGVPEWNDRNDYERVHGALVEAAEWAKQFESTE